MFTLIADGEIYTPQYAGKGSVLLAADKIVKVGEVDRRAVESVGVEVDVIDAEGCMIVPGFIDPHQHLLGGSGEKGFASQTPEISLAEIASAGITTVVGCLGADTTMKTLPGLLAKVKGLKEEGLNAYMWSGGYNVPSTCITNSLREDIMFIDEVVGAGEVAIADKRSSEPTAQDLARIVHEVYVAGTLANKAGVTHFHVGEEEDGLKILRELVSDYNVSPEWLYATHITRSEKLMLEAINLAKDGSYVDIDTVDENLAECLKFYLNHTGWEDKLTVSSDASITSPHNLYNQIRNCIVEERMPIETILPLVTSNTADVLKLEHKGRLAVGKAADVLVVTSEGFELKEVISAGRRLVKDFSLCVKEKFLSESNRTVSLVGEKGDAGENSPSKFSQQKEPTHRAAAPASCSGGK
jgi:beta-aspartyl-dipeptidase (metallo-type)